MITSIEDRLQLVERQTKTIIPYGPVLTSFESLDQIHQQLRLGSFDLVKIVTGWGMHWDEKAIKEIYRLFKRVIVRTTCGDPSVDKKHPLFNTLPQWKNVLEEIKLWVMLLPRDTQLWIEVGNEPNIVRNHTYWFDFAYHLKDVHDKFQSIYKDWNVRLIAAGVSCDTAHLQAAREYTQIASGASSFYDLQAIHAYEVVSFDPSPIQPRTGQLHAAIGLYPSNRRLALTEFGLNNLTMNAYEKERDMRRLCNSTIYKQVELASYYHIATQGMNEEQKRYHVLLT